MSPPFPMRCCEKTGIQFPRVAIFGCANLVTLLTSQSASMPICRQPGCSNALFWAGVFKHVQRSAKRRGCLLSYSQAEAGRELTQPRKHLLAEPCKDLRPPVS